MSSDDELFSYAMHRGGGAAAATSGDRDERQRAGQAKQVVQEQKKHEEEEEEEEEDPLDAFMKGIDEQTQKEKEEDKGKRMHEKIMEKIQTSKQKGTNKANNTSNDKQQQNTATNKGRMDLDENDDADEFMIHLDKKRKRDAKDRETEERDRKRIQEEDGEDSDNDDYAKIPPEKREIEPLRPIGKTIMHTENQQYLLLFADYWLQGEPKKAQPIRLAYTHNALASHLLHDTHPNALLLSFPFEKHRSHQNTIHTYRKELLHRT